MSKSSNTSRISCFSSSVSSGRRASGRAAASMAISDPDVAAAAVGAVATTVGDGEAEGSGGTTGDAEEAAVGPVGAGGE